ncbi:MAG: hypothetical protein ACLRM8_08850 [Alistipes sp.]
MDKNVRDMRSLGLVAAMVAAAELLANRKSFSKSPHWRRHVVIDKQVWRIGRRQAVWLMTRGGGRLADRPIRTPRRASPGLGRLSGPTRTRWRRCSACLLPSRSGRQPGLSGRGFPAHAHARGQRGWNAATAHAAAPVFHLPRRRDRCRSGRMSPC